jgi:two-component system, LuxR family, response regulator FixJ
MEEQPTVFVVDNEDEVRDCVVGAASTLGVAVQQFSSASDTRDYCRPDMPGCFVLDQGAPDAGGLHLLKQLTAKGCRQPFIFVTGAGDVATAVAAMHEGAVDCIEKPLDSQRLLRRVQQAITQDAQFRRRQAERACATQRFATLTARERQVLERVAAGRITKEIARELAISPKTVEVHRSNIMKKLHVESAAELLHLIARHALLPLSDEQS